MNLWCPIDRNPEISISSPGTPVKGPAGILVNSCEGSNLARGRSDYSLPSTPEHIPRCRSENKFPDSMLPLEDQRLMHATSPTLSAPERLRVSDTESCVMRSPNSSGRHVTWAGATTTIRATYRFSNSHSRPRSASNLRSPVAGSPTSHSSPPSPRYARSRTVPHWVKIAKNLWKAPNFFLFFNLVRIYIFFSFMILHVPV